MNNCDYLNNKVFSAGPDLIISQNDTVPWSPNFMGVLALGRKPFFWSSPTFGKKVQRKS